jgi:hypothetical protein
MGTSPSSSFTSICDLGCFGSIPFSLVGNMLNKCLILKQINRKRWPELEFPDFQLFFCVFIVFKHLLLFILSSWSLMYTLGHAEFWREIQIPIWTLVHIGISRFSTFFCVFIVFKHFHSNVSHKGKRDRAKTCFKIRHLFDLLLFILSSWSLMYTLGHAEFWREILESDGLNWNFQIFNFFLCFHCFQALSFKCFPQGKKSDTCSTFFCLSSPRGA